MCGCSSRSSSRPSPKHDGLKDGVDAEYPASAILCLALVPSVRNSVEADRRDRAVIALTSILDAAALHFAPASILPLFLGPPASPVVAPCGLDVSACLT